MNQSVLHTFYKKYLIVLIVICNLKRKILDNLFWLILFRKKDFIQIHRYQEYFPYKPLVQFLKENQQKRTNKES